MSRKLKAGLLTSCEGGVDHNIVSIHIVVHCVCGAAFMSTDSVVAMELAQKHNLTMTHLEGKKK